MAQYPLVVAIAALVSVATWHSPPSAHGAAGLVPRNKPSPLNDPVTEYLQAHNEARAAVGVGPLKWSRPVAEAATRAVNYQRDHKGCNLADFSSGSGSKYGGNQFWSGGLQPVTPRRVVDSWVEEKEFYNYTQNSCAPNHMCGLYTQVVWRKSLELGCAQATCVREKRSLTICSYNPPGNFQGERPY